MPRRTRRQRRSPRNSSMDQPSAPCLAKPLCFGPHRGQPAAISQTKGGSALAALTKVRTRNADLGPQTRADGRMSSILRGGIRIKAMLSPAWTYGRSSPGTYVGPGTKKAILRRLSPSRQASIGPISARSSAVSTPLASTWSRSWQPYWGSNRTRCSVALQNPARRNLQGSAPIPASRLLALAPSASINFQATVPWRTGAAP